MQFMGPVRPASTGRLLRSRSGPLPARRGGVLRQPDWGGGRLKGGRWFFAFVFFFMVRRVFPQMDGLFHGKSQSKMDDFGGNYLYFRTPLFWWFWSRFSASATIPTRGFLETCSPRSWFIGFTTWWPWWTMVDRSILGPELDGKHTLGMISITEQGIEWYRCLWTWFLYVDVCWPRAFCFGTRIARYCSRIAGDLNLIPGYDDDLQCLMCFMWLEISESIHRYSLIFV